MATGRLRPRICDLYFRDCFSASLKNEIFHPFHLNVFFTSQFAVCQKTKYM